MDPRDLAGLAGGAVLFAFAALFTLPSLLDRRKGCPSVRCVGLNCVSARGYRAHRFPCPFGGRVEEELNG